jgi:hypothetical protein
VTKKQSWLRQENTWGYSKQERDGLTTQGFNAFIVNDPKKIDDAVKKYLL